MHLYFIMKRMRWMICCNTVDSLKTIRYRPRIDRLTYVRLPRHGKRVGNMLGFFSLWEGIYYLLITADAEI